MLAMPLVATVGVLDPRIVAFIISRPIATAAIISAVMTPLAATLSGGILAAVPADVLEKVRQAIPVGHIATVDEIAPAYVFLASADGSHFQGQCISPNGGDMLL